MVYKLRDFARIGLVHHLLYPQSTDDPDYHADTLVEFVQRHDIDTFDFCIPYGEERRKRVLEALEGNSKEKVYALHLFPSRKISLGSTCPIEQAQTRLILEDQIQLAALAGVTGFVFGSGTDVPASERFEAKRAFARFCRWFCDNLRPHGITAMLEPFDRTVDKKYLYGSTAECVELIDSLRPEVDNFGIELDIAHLPLMGESFKDAIHNVRHHLKRVHLGNCVCADPKHPWYGDQHPPIGLDGGAIDVPQLAEVLELLLDIGYLSKDKPGALVLEIQPFPGKTVDETVEDNMSRLAEAWYRVTGYKEDN